MLELDKVNRAQFAKFVDQDFEIALKDGAPLKVQLAEVRSLGAAGAGGREPFALEFRGDASVRLPRCIYVVSHAQLGTMEIFRLSIRATGRRLYLRSAGSRGVDKGEGRG